MSAARRREWFTKLSDINYDYALAVYGRLKKRSRDITGALNTSKRRLVNESNSVISNAEEARLKSDVEATLKELNLLFTQSAPLDRPVASYQKDQTDGLEELSKMSNRLLRMRIVAPYGSTPYGTHPGMPRERDEWGQFLLPSFRSVGEIDDYINILRHDITAKETLLNKSVTEHGKLTETVAILTRTGEEGVKSLQVRLQGLRDKKQEVLRGRRLQLEGFEPVNSLAALNTIQDILTSTFSIIPDNTEKRFSSVKLREFQEQELNLKNTKLQLQTDLNRMSAKKIHLESHKASGNTVCPKCNHHWVAGFSQEQLTQIEELIAAQETKINNLEKEMVVIAEKILEIQQYSELYRDYSRCVNNWPILNPFWDHLQENKYITESPRKALSLIDTLRFDLELEVTAKKLEHEAEEVLVLIRSAAEVGDASLIDVKLKLEECTLAVETLTADITKLQYNVSVYLQYKSQLNEAADLANKISVMMINLEQNNIEMVEMMRRETLSHCIRQLQHSLAIKNETLSEIALKKGIIADLEFQIERLAIEEAAAELLVHELSPTDGLIAENLFGFIRTFVAQMNALIRKIWAYPLQIQDCGMANADGAELDYKFPLMVGSRDNIVDDVKLGSSGMQEIVDLAFKVKALQQLGLGDYPLFLDEPNKTFDAQHRTTAVAMIKNLMDTQGFTQLFMIDHFETSYGAYTNAETCVMDANNITVPDVYNQHVTIT
jgi:hypothetical protein